MCICAECGGPVTTSENNDVTTSEPDDNAAVHTVAMTMMVVIGVIAALFV